MGDDFEVIAKTILVLVRAINVAPARSKLRDVHNETLRIHLRRFIDRYWAGKLCASRACLKAARQDGIKDIRKLEPRQLPASIRKKYHLEHYLPVADLRDALLKMPNPTAVKILQLITSAPIKKVWVLKEEDKKLRRFRRGDPSSAYKIAEIEVIC